MVRRADARLGVRVSGGVFKAHELLYLSTLGSRVVEKKDKFKVSTLTAVLDDAASPKLFPSSVTRVPPEG